MQSINNEAQADGRRAEGEIAPRRTIRPARDIRGKARPSSSRAPQASDAMRASVSSVMPSSSIAPSSVIAPSRVARASTGSASVRPSAAASASSSSAASASDTVSHIADVDFTHFDSTRMLSALNDFHSGAAGDADAPGRAECARLNLACVRGYDDESLMVLAEVGYRYLQNGGYRLAKIYFDGLSAVKPEEPYFWMARGLIAERQGDLLQARTFYAHAMKLSPLDPRPELNLAEVEHASGSKERATRHLESAREKAVRSADAQLVVRANALLSLINKRSPVRARGVS